MLPIIAIPVIHSSGAWIVSGGGYIAGTMSTSWIGAFVAGNLSTLATLGLVSGASVFGTLVATGSTALGAGLTKVGLGGLAASLGLVPKTFLWLTASAWGVVGAVVASSVITIILTRFMGKLNKERQQGGLEKISILQLIKDVKAFERDSIRQICNQLSQNIPKFKFNNASEILTYKGVEYKIGKIRYVINKDGSEELIFGKYKVIVQVKPRL